MAGAEAVLDLAIVAGALVLVLDQERDRRAGGQPFVDAGKDADGIRLLPLRDQFRLAGAAAVEKGLDVGLGEREPRRAAIHHAADRRPVALAPGGDAEQVAEAVVGHAEARLLRRRDDAAGLVLRRRPAAMAAARQAFAAMRTSCVWVTKATSRPASVVDPRLPDHRRLAPVDGGGLAEDARAERRRADEVASCFRRWSSRRPPGVFRIGARRAERVGKGHDRAAVEHGGSRAEVVADGEVPPSPRIRLVPR